MRWRSPTSCAPTTPRLRAAVLGGRALPLPRRRHRADLARRPVVHRDHRGRVTGLHYSPRMDYVPLLDAASAHGVPACSRATGRAAGRSGVRDEVLPASGRGDGVLERPCAARSHRVRPAAKDIGTCRGATSITTRRSAGTASWPDRGVDVETVQFTQMKDGTRPEYQFLHDLERQYIAAATRPHPGQPAPARRQPRRLSGHPAGALAADRPPVPRPTAPTSR